MPRIKKEKRNVKVVYNLNKSFTAEESFGGTYVYSSNQTLQGWWRLNEDVSISGDAIDSSFRTGRDGTFDIAQERPSFTNLSIPSSHGETIQNGVCTFGDEASGHGDCVHISNGVTWNDVIGDGAGTSKMSFSLWARRTGGGGSNSGRLLAIGNPSAGGGMRLMWGSSQSGVIRMQLNWDGSASDRAEWRSPILPMNTWVHLVITYDASAPAGTVPKFYIDGEEIVVSVQEASAGSWEGFTTNFATIGSGDNSSASQGFDGDIADVAIWNSILSFDDVKAIYALSQNQELTKVSSGYLDNPYRVILNERDNATGSYPTILRTTGRTVTLGNSPISPYNATREIIFGPADDVHYADVLQRVDHDKYLDNWIASPNQDDVLGQSHGDPNPKYEMFTTGVVSPFVSTQGMKISIDQRGVGSPRHDFEPFDESRVYLGDTPFYSVGTPNNVYPGFSSPLDDKIQIVIPIDSAEERTISRFNSWQMHGDYGSDRYPGGSFPVITGPASGPTFMPNNAGKQSHYWNKYGTEFSGSYHTGFKYYNPSLRVWEDQGLQVGPGKIGPMGADWTMGPSSSSFDPPWQVTNGIPNDERGDWGTFYTMFYHGRPVNGQNYFHSQNPVGNNNTGWGPWGSYPTWETDFGTELSSNLNDVRWPMSTEFKQYQFTMSHHMGFFAGSYDDLIAMGYDKIGAPTMSGMGPNNATFHATASNVFKMSNYIAHPFALEKAVIEIPISVRRKNGNIYANRPKDGKGNRGDGHSDENSTVDSAIRDIDNYVFFLYRQARNPGAKQDSIEDFKSSQRFLIASGSVACYNPNVFSSSAWDPDAPPGVREEIEARGLPHNPAVTIKLLQTHASDGSPLEVPRILDISGSAAAGMEGSFTGAIRIEMIPAVGSGQFLGGTRVAHRNYAPDNGFSLPHVKTTPLIREIHSNGVFVPSQVGTMVVQDFWPGGTTYPLPVSGAFGTTPSDKVVTGAAIPQFPEIRGVVFALQNGCHFNEVFDNVEATSKGYAFGLTFNGALVQGINYSYRTAEGPGFPFIQYFGRDSVPAWGGKRVTETKGYPLRGKFKYTPTVTKWTYSVSRTDDAGPIAKSALPEDSRPLRLTAGFRTQNEKMTKDSAWFSRQVSNLVVGPFGYDKVQDDQHGWFQESNQFSGGAGLPDSSGTTTLPIVFGDLPVSTPSPYVLLPGDELILGCDAGISSVPCSGTSPLTYPAGPVGGAVPGTTSNNGPLAFNWGFPATNLMNLPAGLPTSGSLSEISGSFMVFEKGPAKLTLFGSMIREDREKLFELNQNLSSDSIHEALHFDNPVVDQFDIENRGELAHGYTSDYVLGGMFGRYTFENFHKIYYLLNGEIFRYTTGPLGAYSLLFPTIFHPTMAETRRGRSVSFAKGSHSIYNVIAQMGDNPSGIYQGMLYQVQIPNTVKHYWAFPMRPETLVNGAIYGKITAFGAQAEGVASPSGVVKKGGLRLDRHGMRFLNVDMLNSSKTSPLLRCAQATDFNERYFDTLMPQIQEWAKKSGLQMTSDIRTKQLIVYDMLNGLQGCRLNESASAGTGDPAKPNAHHMYDSHKTALPYFNMIEERQVKQTFRINLHSKPAKAVLRAGDGDRRMDMNLSTFNNCSDEFGPGWSRVSWCDWEVPNTPAPLGNSVDSYWKYPNGGREVLNSERDEKACFDVMFRKGYDFSFRTGAKLLTYYTADGSPTAPDPAHAAVGVYTSDVIRLFYNMGPGAAHGYAYGIMDTSPKFTTATYRAGRYGQNRDMLEQRKFAKFYITPTVTRTVNSLIPSFKSTIGSGEQDAPITCYFVDSADGVSLVDPYTTDCSNMDLEASSSCPFTDGHICNRYDPKPVFIFNARMTCVIKGTQIHTDLGDIPVENVTTDTIIRTHDFRTSEMDDFEVLKTFSNTVSGWCKIRTNMGFELSCSLDHPIMSKSEESTWELKASDASPGDHVWVLVDGRIRDDVIKSVEIFEESVDVYNMTVKDVHTYFSNGILSHNMSLRVSSQTASGAAARESINTKGGGRQPQQLNPIFMGNLR